MAPRALILDDEALLVLEMEEILAAEGFETIVVCTEAAAMAVPTGALAVAVVNLRLNGQLVGQRVIRALRERHPNLPVVVVTGYDGSAPQADLRGLGWPTMRLHKPNHGEHLATAVQAVIAQARDGQRPQGQRRRFDEPDPVLA